MTSFDICCIVLYRHSLILVQKGGDMDPYFESNEEIQATRIQLIYSGGIDATQSYIDLYDLSKALYGFHRSLAITYHYLLHDEIITKTPYARDFRIITVPPKEGSFEVIAFIWVASKIIEKFTTASKDTILGHVAFSLYDYIVKKCLGIHVDMSKSLYHQCLDEKREKDHKAESLAQKVESSVRYMHRPIQTQSAIACSLLFDEKKKIEFDRKTLDMLDKMQIDTDSNMYTGRVSGYSANTRSGMVYSEEEKRAIPFEIEKGIDIDTGCLARSLSLYDALKRKNKKGRSGFFKFNAKRVTNRMNFTKKYYITDIYTESLVENKFELG